MAKRTFITISPGEQFGRWTVLGPAPELRYRLLCRCACGTVRLVGQGHLSRGKTRSCGCLHRAGVSERNRRHGESSRGHIQAEYRIWLGMKQRCGNPKVDSYHKYGGRGIKVCREWAESFPTFLRDMGRRPSSSHSIDRIDNDGDYEPENCRWLDPKGQGQNTRQTRFITANGQTKSASEWAAELGIQSRTLRHRIDRLGWSPEEAVSRPAGPQGGKSKVADGSSGT